MIEIRDAELMSVSPDEVVVTMSTAPEVEVVSRVGDHAVVTTGPVHVARIGGLEPDTDYPLGIEGVADDSDLPYLPSTVRTLARPAGRLLSVVATVNDVHFGEMECGKLVGWGEDWAGPVFRNEPGERPYPDTMNEAAVEEITALRPDAVVVKGDLTTHGTEAELEQFRSVWSCFGDRLHYVRGNHDAALSDHLAADAPFSIELPGAILAVLDTVRFRRPNGQVTRAQIAWLDELAAAADRPVFVFGHHHVWNPASQNRHDTYFGITPDDSEALVDVVARREAIAGYFAGHTHRNRVRRFSQARDVPFVEVACVKDYPGAWAEYRIHEDGFTQVMRRISSPAALSWTEKTRGMFHGMYREYALGRLDWRCYSQSF